MSYSNGRITAPVSIRDLQRCVPVTLHRTNTDTGLTETRSSSDDAVLCSSNVGETIFARDRKGNWRVTSRVPINPWARYRPIPCSQAENNKPKCITPAQRLSERYGIDPPVDMFSADDITAYENYVNNQEFTENNGFYIHLRPWGNSHFKRITDFVKTDNNGNEVAGKGYDHNAECDTVVITLNGKLYSITPLIPKGQRTIYLPDGEVLRFQFPNDHLWVDEYYKYVVNPVTSRITHIYQNEEWLSSLDFMAFNTYSTGTFASVMRSVIIFKWDTANSRWKYLNRVNDTVTNNVDEDRPYNDTNKNAWLDLTRHGGLDSYGDMDFSDTWQINHPEYDTDDNATMNVKYFRANPYTTHIEDHHDELLRNLEGKLLFLEIWRQSNSSTNLIPIQGLAYEVEMHRTQAPVPPATIHAYIEGVFMFELLENNGNAITVSEDGIIFTCLICPSTFLRSGEEIRNGDSYVEQNARLIMTRLRSFYDSVSVRVGSMDFNLFDSILEADVYQEHTYDGVLWKEVDCLIYLEESGTIDPAGWTAEINAMIKRQMQSSIAGHDDLGIKV